MTSLTIVVNRERLGEPNNTLSLGKYNKKSKL